MLVLRYPALDDAPRPVGGVVVDDDHLDRRVGRLRAYRRECGIQRGRLVAYGHDDRDLGFGAHSGPRRLILVDEGPMPPPRQDRAYLEFYSEPQRRIFLSYVRPRPVVETAFYLFLRGDGVDVPGLSRCPDSW